MIVTLVFIVVISAATWLTLKWRKVNSFWEEKGVPHNKPHPIMGSLTFLQRKNPAHWLRDLYNQFQSPYVGIWLFWRPALVVNCPEIARRILVKDADNFRNRFLSSGKSDPVGALNIFTVNEPLWSNIRRRLTAVFTAAKLRSLEGLVQEKSKDLITRYKTELEDDSEILNTRVINSDYTTDLIGEASFGIQSMATRTGDSVIRKVTRDFMSFNFFRGLCWSSIFFCPELVDIFGFSLFPKHTTRFLGSLFRSVVAQRGGFEAPVKEPRDLLDALLKLKQESSEDEGITEEVILAQAAIFLQGGFDTTGSILTWTMLEMSYAPHVQDRLYSELTEARQKLGKDLDSSALTELPYLNAVIKESLRKYPPMGWLDRVCTAEYQVNEDLMLPAGTVVYVNATGIMMDARYFPEPELYQPDRFLPQNERNLRPYTFMPFGEGPRNCIGMRFAYLGMRHALSSIVQNFFISPGAKTPKANQFPVETKGLFHVPHGNVTLNFTPRK